MNTAKEPLVSIIVPVYNVESYLDDCLDSIKQQTYHNLEIIVIEDCSTDNSRQVLQRYLKDNRIKLIQHSENGGLSAARNTGIEAATGKYIMFVDSDDVVGFQLVEACVKCALKNDADLITYGYTPFKDGLLSTQLPFPVENLEYNPAVQHDDYFNLPHFAWVKFIRSSIIRESTLRFPVGLYYEDWPFHWHLGLVAKNKYQIPVNFYLYRQRGTSITGSTDEKLLDLFIIHSQVRSLVNEHEAIHLKKLLANKIKQSHWSILSRIDSKLLPLAMSKAKESEEEMRYDNYECQINFRNTLISTIIRMPEATALPTLRLLRQALKAKRAII